MHPRSRLEGIASTEVDGEVVLYDSERQSAHCLDAAAAVVWRSCDGDTSPEEIAERLRAEVDQAADLASVEVALNRLDDAGLLEHGAGAARSGVNRRVALKRLGAAALAPAVLSIALPAAHAQASCKLSGQPCVDQTECCDGFCTSADPNNKNCNNCIEQNDPVNDCGPTGHTAACCSGTCNNGTCVTCGIAGDSCSVNSECCSNNCSGGTTCT